MNIHPFDDFPFHQTLANIGSPINSDPHFNDGYYVVLFSKECLFFCGLRLYPNNNVMDGFAGAVFRGEQRNMRAARALWPDAAALAVGPLALSIPEPMVRQRWTLGENATEVSFDVELIGCAPPRMEAVDVQTRYGRLYNHVLRYPQVCRASGTAQIGEQRFEIDRWAATRDHSWGIRASMGPATPIRGTTRDTDPESRRALRFWVTFEIDDVAGFFQTHENSTGQVMDFEGHVFDRVSQAFAKLTSLKHALTYYPDSRRLRSGTLELTDAAGVVRKFLLQTHGDPAHPQGFGYWRGWSDGGQPGEYRGAQHVEADRFTVSDPRGSAAPTHVPPQKRLGGTAYGAALRTEDGREGAAYIGHGIYGAYEPYGFAR